MNVSQSSLKRECTIKWNSTSCMNRLWLKQNHKDHNHNQIDIEPKNLSATVCHEKNLRNQEDAKPKRHLNAAATPRKARRLTKLADCNITANLQPTRSVCKRHLSATANPTRTWKTHNELIAALRQAFSSTALHADIIRKRRFIHTCVLMKLGLLHVS